MLSIFQSLLDNESKELNFWVLLHLDIVSLGRAFSVCEQWNSWSSSEFFWKNYCYIHLDLKNYRKPDKPWKWILMSKLKIKERDMFNGIGRYEEVGISYEGEIADGDPDGFGTQYWDNGDVYQGFFKNKLRHGVGKLFWQEGDSYEGDFVNNRRTGFGVYKWNDGDSYEGSFKLDAQDGFGVLTWADGERYEGDWKMNKKHGFGSFYFSNGDKFEGIFIEDIRQGYGVLTWKAGNKYEGNWNDDDITGTGRLTWWNGNRYFGKWKSSTKVAGVWYERISNWTFYKEQDEDKLEIDLSYVNPIVKKSIEEKKCTFSVTGRNFYFQYLYKTARNDDRTHGICLVCKEICKPENVILLESEKVCYGGNFFCECGYGYLHKPCKAM